MPIDDIPQVPTPDLGLPEFKLDEVPFRFEGESDFPIRKAMVVIPIENRKEIKYFIV